MGDRFPINRGAQLQADQLFLGQIDSGRPLHRREGHVIRSGHGQHHDRCHCLGVTHPVAMGLADGLWEETGHYCNLCARWLVSSARVPGRSRLIWMENSVCVAGIIRIVFLDRLVFTDITC